MMEQFKYHTKGYRISLYPFKGDPSITYKWEISQILKADAAYTAIPVIGLYFGDYDTKGIQLAETAFRHMRLWSGLDDDQFRIYRIGLNEGDGERFGIPDSLDKPGSYQWEALDDKKASKLILGAIHRFYDVGKINELIDNEKEITQAIKDHIREFDIDDYTYLFGEENDDDDDEWDDD